TGHRISGRPHSGCRTFGTAERMRVPSPAARMTTVGAGTRGIVVSAPSSTALGDGVTGSTGGFGPPGRGSSPFPPASMDDDQQIGYQALPRGVPVFTSDGVELGRVHRVQDNAREHIFDGILVRTRAGRVFVDA